MQTVAAPDGELLWVSGVLPGKTVDITAARRFKIAEKMVAFLGLLADLGYIGLHPDVITGYRRRRGEKTLPEGRKATNRVQAGLRCIGDRIVTRADPTTTCPERNDPVVNPSSPAETRLGHAQHEARLLFYARSLGTWSAPP